MADRRGAVFDSSVQAGLSGNRHDLRGRSSAAGIFLQDGAGRRGARQEAERERKRHRRDDGGANESGKYATREQGGLAKNGETSPHGLYPLSGTACGCGLSARCAAAGLIDVFGANSACGTLPFPCNREPHWRQG